MWASSKTTPNVSSRAQQADFFLHSRRECRPAKSRDLSSLSECALTPLECAVPRFRALSPLECADPKMHCRNPFRMRSSEKRWGEGGPLWLWVQRSNFQTCNVQTLMRPYFFTSF